MDELVERAQEMLSGRHVFGDAIRQDGGTVIPAADVVVFLVYRWRMAAIRARIVAGGADD